MLFDFGREICGNLATAETREWLVTNGIGGYASGTVSGLLTRRYHGLLMAALEPPLGRTLLLAKLDETVEYDGIYPESGRVYPLHANRWADGTREPDGFVHLNRFHLENTTPVWTYACANALLEKRIWMQPGANTTYIQYKLVRASGPMSFEAKAFINYRDYHATTIFNDWSPEVVPANHDGHEGLAFRVHDEARPFYLFAAGAEATITPEFDWYEGFFLSLEEYRGQNDVEEDHIYAALLRAVLKPGDTLTVVASTTATPNMDSDAAYQLRRDHEKALLDRARASKLGRYWSPEIEHLVLAADQFVVKRPTPVDENGRSIIAGYHWFSDWGRDTMIALPGLTLATGRPEVAASILRTYAHFVDQGMIPNRFPDEGEVPEYNTVDATLWYFQAVRSYVRATNDTTLLAELFPVLADIIKWHRRGTRYNIHMKDDGLLFAGEEGVQLTWMDAKVDNWVVTDRIGKPVEINALWYNALCIMVEFADSLGEDTAEYEALATKVKDGFGAFWHEEMGYCYDVLDTPDEEPDLSLRPNQLLAVSLPHSPLSADQQRSVVDACARHLLTAHGLRSLSNDDPAYIGIYGGDQLKRDGAYHQGTVWGWLLGPFISAHLRVYGDPAQARSYLNGLFHGLYDHGVGSISEIFDGDPPFTPRGCIAQAWSIAEVLRIWLATGEAGA